MPSLCSRVLRREQMGAGCALRCIGAGVSWWLRGEGGAGVTSLPAEPGSAEPPHKGLKGLVCLVLPVEETEAG